MRHAGRRITRALEVAGGRNTGGDFRGPQDPAKVCPASDSTSLPSACDDGPFGNGTGGPAYKLPNETNPSKWPRGTAGMASSSAGVSGSQFFITTGDAPSLATSGVYNHFGQVTSGMDVIDSIQVGDRMTSIDIKST